MSLLASQDPLTGIFNRRKVVTLIEEMIEAYHKRGQPGSLLLLDIDRFKTINDTFGHDVGDRVLQNFVSFLQNNVRHTDFVGRWGGDEFIILCPHSNVQDVQQLMQRIERNMELPGFAHKQEIGISFGMAACQEQDTVDSLIKRADIGLYHAKQKKRNH